MLLRLRWVCIRGMARAGRGKGGSVGGGGASGPVLETGWGALRVRNSEEVPRLMVKEYPEMIIILYCAVANIVVHLFLIV